ncbi:hypothetical protein [Krasilnikoviella flava]|uniref:Uncharacterized protein n=1 Tax=Krasilnikoviella flava TaxID=526729 RepID=A0A1T5LGW1_9MICO|nr:hypothetical protein [Krasilnikoviella flava]SKC74935.1 hypothetical protein SAMN04324258_3345 [Krasilnikoviella flava]
MTTSVRTLVRGVALAGVAGALALVVAACASPAPSGGGSSEPTAASPSASPEPSAPASPSGEVTGVPGPGEHVRGLPDGAEGTFDSPAGAGWSPTPGVLLVVTYGSSTCPRLAEAEAGWGGRHEAIDVGLVDPDPGPCTMDYVPTTSAVAVPPDADAGSGVTVRLGDIGKVEVAPRAADGEAGPLAWVAP